MSAIIDIEPTHVTGTGYRYRVWHDGAVLIESTREPWCAAARALSKAGVTGRMQMRRNGKIAMTGLITVEATRTVIEGDYHGPRFGAFVERQYPTLELAQ